MTDDVRCCVAYVCIIHVDDVDGSVDVVVGSVGSDDGVYAVNNDDGVADCDMCDGVVVDHVLCDVGINVYNVFDVAIVDVVDNIDDCYVCDVDVDVAVDSDVDVSCVGVGVVVGVVGDVVLAVDDAGVVDVCDVGGCGVGRDVHIDNVDDDGTVVVSIAGVDDAW